MEEKPEPPKATTPEKEPIPQRRELRPFPIKKIATTSIHLWLVAFAIPSFLVPITVWILGGKSDKQIAVQMMTKEAEDKDWLRKSVAESVADPRSAEAQAKKAQEQGILPNAPATGVPKVFTIDVGGVKKKGSIVFPSGWTVKPGAAQGTVGKAVHKDANNNVAQVMVGARLVKDMPEDIWDFDPLTMIPKQDYMTFTDSGKITISGRHALMVKTEVRSPEILSGISRIYSLMWDNVLVTLTYTTSPYDPHLFDEFEKTFLECLVTFKLDLP